MKQIHLRDNRGAAVISLCLALSLFLIFLIFFTFDMNRLQMAQRQLGAICDAAALAGSGMLTAKDTSFEDTSLDTLYTTQLAAEQYSINMIAMGNILGQPIYNPSAGSAVSGGIPLSTVTSASALNNPSPGGLNVWVQLCSPSQNYAVVPPGNSSARALYIKANYGYIPFMSMLGVASVNLPTTSTSGLQKLFVVMVFDCSGSMDDNTTVSFVYRRWSQSTDGNTVNGANGGKGQYVYTVVGNPGNGQLWQYTGLNYANQPNGTAVNVLPPQNLDFLGFIFANTYHAYAGSASAFSSANPPLAFDIAVAAYIPWQAGAIAGIYNSSYASYPVSGSGFQGPYYDNYFGTPPGNCRVKYGAAQASGAQYGGNLAANTSNPTYVMNTWTGNPATSPGPGFSPGYYNAATGSNDGNVYFYDPNSMPMASTNANYAAFTDMVANITNVNPPVTQPFYGPGTFTGFNETFSTGNYTVGVADTTSSTSSITIPYEGDRFLSGGTYKFPNIAYVVEAARGNLDCDLNGGIATGTALNYDNALLAYGSNFGVIARTDCASGYQKAYQRLAMYVMQPYATAIDGASRFFQNLCQTASCNFGFMGFSVAPATTSQYNCFYTSPWTVSNFLWFSLALGAPANTYKPSAVYSSWVYEPPQLYGGKASNPGALINPNFWINTQFTSTDGGVGLFGPAGGTSTKSVGFSGTGRAYHSSLNTAGPTSTTWLTVPYVANSPPPSNNDTLWAFNNPGFQIPRIGINGYTGENTAFGAVAQQANWSGFGMYWTSSWGINGLYHALPLYDTAGLEALNSGLSALRIGSQMNANANYGYKTAIVFFTDGVPTDDNTPYSQYKSQIVGPAQTAGTPIYAIGLALNSSVQSNQSVFLTTLANKGACGSQQFQVTNAASLQSTFTGIARQLAQCQR